MKCFCSLANGCEVGCFCAPAGLAPCSACQLGTVCWARRWSWQSTRGLQSSALLAFYFLPLQNMRLPLLPSSTSLLLCPDYSGLLYPRWPPWLGTRSALYGGGFGQWTEFSKEKWQRGKPASLVHREEERERQTWLYSLICWCPWRLYLRRRRREERRRSSLSLESLYLLEAHGVSCTHLQLCLSQCSNSGLVWELVPKWGCHLTGIGLRISQDQWCG